jgi:hypothetical protein
VEAHPVKGVIVKRLFLLLSAAALLTGGLWAAAAVAGSHRSADSGHVTICHRTGSHHNPYVVISPSASGVYNGHYSQHNENAVFPNTASDGKWGDIIPPFQYKGVTYSLNWNAQGQATFNNGCRPATSGGTTTTSSPNTTTTVVTPGATTTVTTPGATTTVTTPGRTVTVTTTTSTAPLTPPPPHKHHKKHPQRQTFTPPNVKLPHTQ